MPQLQKRILLESEADAFTAASWSGSDGVGVDAASRGRAACSDLFGLPEYFSYRHLSCMYSVRTACMSDLNFA